jgi:resuscitation-promoting factor RpfA
MSTRSYVPKHSRRHAPNAARGTVRRVTTVVGTLGAAAVVGTTLASAADAAPSYYRVWDRVAHCESTNHWHINTGNGFYGGLQFSAGTWRAHGGHKYAGQASRATRAEQIEVARRVLASQGPGAWPVCGPRAGLTRSSGHATHAALPRVAGTTSHTSTHKKHKTKHHAKRTVHHKKSRATHAKTYRVHSGDTLAKIAHKKHVHGGWHALYRANRSHLSNPNVLRVGQVLRLP